ncbi:stage II sporulation protein M [Ideonella sp. DXS29W]|uniref:Stage II sporulation protein M n=1 Tax=Ideonella lacteola TaxID=2984193 RepID=A0ABU9BNP5_9BURK
MNPAQFEAAYGAQWDELEALLDATRAGPPGRWFDRRAPRSAPPDAERLVRLYRAVCEHLALAQSRAYPLHLADRLESLAQRAHQLIYRQHELGWQRLVRYLRTEVPAALRAQRRYVWMAALLFYGPALLVGLLTWWDPGQVLILMDAETASEFERMYDRSTDAIGRGRGAATDWYMFGFYIRHNIGIGFQCFAGGLFAGVGSVFFLVFNALQIGGVAGFLTARGHGPVFWSFVASHSPFELSAIVFSGAAGLMLGHAWLSPGRWRRGQALAQAARRAVPLVSAATLLFLVAAALEAFWSSAAGVAPAAKYATSAVGWCLVWAYTRWRAGS